MSTYFIEFENVVTKLRPAMFLSLKAYKISLIQQLQFSIKPSYINNKAILKGIIYTS